MICRTLLYATLTLGSAAAFAVVPEPAGFRMEDYRAPVPNAVPGASVFHTHQLEDLAEQDSAVFIDVLAAPRRPKGMKPNMPWLPEAHRNLPKSLWWPGVGHGAISPELEARFRERLGEVVKANPGSVVVFYCKSDCWLSWNAAKRAASYGFPVAWFPEGADGWEAAGLPMQDAKPEFLDQPPIAP